MNVLEISPDLIKIHKSDLCRKHVDLESGARRHQNRLKHNQLRLQKLILKTFKSDLTRSSSNIKSELGPT